LVSSFDSNLLSKKYIEISKSILKEIRGMIEGRRRIAIAANQQKLTTKPVPRSRILISTTLQLPENP
jgi:hypothetical protein